MMLHEAIRLGAMLKPQAYGEFFTIDGKSCALGAALDAVGRLDEAYPWLYEWEYVIDHPITGEPRSCLMDVIVDLNDEYRWTREQIADWLETREALIVAAYKQWACEDELVTV